MDSALSLLSSRVSAHCLLLILIHFVYIFLIFTFLPSLLGIAFCRIPSFIAHARKSKFFSSRVEKKIAAPKFGDVFIGANGGKSAAEPLIDPCDPFSSIPPPPSSRATESPAAAEGEFMSREDLKKKHEFNEKEQVEPFLATYLDVAVLRCLFTSQWIEEGIEWALHFLYRRLETISKYREKRRETLFRSNSLPTPKRKSDDKTCLESSKQTESKSCRPKTDSTNESSLIAKESTQLKTGSSFQELRRSSFSGLPGMCAVCLGAACRRFGGVHSHSCLSLYILFVSLLTLQL